MWDYWREMAIELAWEGFLSLERLGLSLLLSLPGIPSYTAIAYKVPTNLNRR